VLRQLWPIENRSGHSVTRQGKTYLDFTSNDYLGATLDPHLQAALQAAVSSWPSGSTGSRLLSGDYEIAHELEAALAEWLEMPAALVFNSGYHANLGVLPAIVAPGDMVFVDRLSHASILDGVQLSQAKWLRFRHHDMDHLGQLLRRYSVPGRQLFVVTESLFSMDGDSAPLPELLALRAKFGFKLILDEAHAIGVYGLRGEGRAVGLVGADQVDGIVGTFGKALGSYGAFFCGSSDMKKRLIQQSRPFVYSTGLPPYLHAFNLAAIRWCQSASGLRAQVIKNSQLFRDLCHKKGLRLLGESQIVPIVYGDAARTAAHAERLRSAGFWVSAIHHPTVAKGQSRLRLSITASYTEAQLSALAQQLSL